jgi:peptidoglycan L-alanyl-D-glutamate endopeptidase CwlK
MSSRKLLDLHPDLIPLANEFLNNCTQAGLDILVTCTYRSADEQNALYAQGRTLPGKIVTNAKGGQSEHNFEMDGKPASKAFDIVPLVNKVAIWNEHDPAWDKVASVWAAMKPINGFWLDWYGKKNAQFHEFPHFCLKEVT